MVPYIYNGVLGVIGNLISVNTRQYKAANASAAKWWQRPSIAKIQFTEPIYHQIHCYSLDGKEPTIIRIEINEACDIYQKGVPLYGQFWYADLVVVSVYTRSMSPACKHYIDTLVCPTLSARLGDLVDTYVNPGCYAFVFYRPNLVSNDISRYDVNSCYKRPELIIDCLLNDAGRCSHKANGIIRNHMYYLYMMERHIAYKDMRRNAALSYEANRALIEYAKQHQKTVIPSIRSIIHNALIGEVNNKQYFLKEIDNLIPAASRFVDKIIAMRSTELPSNEKILAETTPLVDNYIFEPRSSPYSRYHDVKRHTCSQYWMLLHSTLIPYRCEADILTQAYKCLGWIKNPYSTPLEATVAFSIESEKKKVMASMSMFFYVDSNVNFSLNRPFILDSLPPGFECKIGIKYSFVHKCIMLEVTFNISNSVSDKAISYYIALSQAIVYVQEKLNDFYDHLIENQFPALSENEEQCRLSAEIYALSQTDDWIRTTYDVAKSTF